MFFVDQRGHGAADGGFNVDGRIVAGFRQASRQHHMAVENGACRVGDRILLVIAFGQHGIKGGNGPAATDAVARAFDQCRQLGEDGRRIAFSGRRLADGQGYLTLRHGVARQ
ncbi:hypothetical protein D3C72_1418750 [compost metagenome]